MEIVAGIAVALAVLALGAWAWERRKGAAATPASHAVPGPPLTAEEFAFVAGGPRRVVECAIAALVADDVLRVNRAGHLTPTGATPRTLTAVETQVVETVGEGHSVGHAIVAVRRSAPVTAVGRAVTARGVVSRSESRRLHRTGQGKGPGGSGWSQSTYAQTGLLDTTMLAGTAGLVAIGGLTAFPDDRADGLTQPGTPEDRANGYIPSGGNCGNFGDSGGSCGGGSSCGGASSCGGGGGGGGCGGGGGGGGCGGGGG